MPKGYKSKNGYATVTTKFGGLDYRQIASHMSSRGHKMNHATARNVFLRAMKKLAVPLCQLQGIEDDILIESASRDPRFQEGMIQIVADIYDRRPTKKERS